MSFQNKISGLINIWLILGLVILIIVGLFFFNTDKAEGPSVTNEPEAESAQVVNTPEATELTSGTYTSYDTSKLSDAESGTVLLFFHASWCPSCRGLDKNIKENLNDLPEDVTILQVNYDSETDLKKKYGVVRQHTLVQVDADGNQIQTLTGLTNTLDQVLKQI